MEMQAFSLIDEESGSKARISLFGATIISWVVQGQEKLFLSEKAVLDGSKAIRGGIPPVFPVFGKATSGPCAELPQHGFARNNLWTIKHKATNQVVLSLTPNDISEAAKKAWPFEFELEYKVQLQGPVLSADMMILNKDKKDFDFQTLLHTYFRVHDIANVHVEGLGDIVYKDKISSSEIKEEASAVKCTAETDRVYPNVNKTVKIVENEKVAIEIQRKNLDDVVLWNPWTGCSKMADFGPDDGYKQMVCVEAGAVSTWHKLSAGQTYLAHQTITARL